MLKYIIDRVVGKDLEELDRWRSNWESYRRWLAEFPAISMTLDNMKNEVSGKEPMDACHPPGPAGPWTLENLRYHLRLMQLNVAKTDTKYDSDWYDEFNKKHELLQTANVRIHELEQKLQDAVDMLLIKNREGNTLRFLCSDVYHNLKNDNIDLAMKSLENLPSVRPQQDLSTPPWNT